MQSTKHHAHKTRKDRRLCTDGLTPKTSKLASRTHFCACRGHWYGGYHPNTVGSSVDARTSIICAKSKRFFQPHQGTKTESMDKPDWYLYFSNMHIPSPVHASAYAQEQNFAEYIPWDPRTMKSHCARGPTLPTSNHGQGEPTGATCTKTKMVSTKMKTVCGYERNTR